MQRRTTKLVHDIKGITVFKFVIWGGISSDIRSEFLFYGDAYTISDDIPPQMTNWNMVIPILMYFLTFTHQKQVFASETLAA